MDWVEAIGYQHEVLHAAALAHLLGDAIAGPKIAARLSGVDSVSAVHDIKREARVGPNPRRVVDVAAVLEIPRGDPLRLGVEIKVDSAWTAEQLTESVSTSRQGVLLAVGYTGLAATQAELQVLDERPWRLVGPFDWTTILQAERFADTQLESYATQVREEAKSQADAIRRVNLGQDVVRGRQPVALGHWAYFHEVVAAAGETLPWERKTQISGPLLTRWLYEAGDEDGGAFVELMGLGLRRELRVKCWSHGKVGMPELQTRAAKLVESFNGTPGRRASARSRTATAVSWDLDSRRPKEAAALCEGLAARLVEGWRT